MKKSLLWLALANPVIDTQEAASVDLDGVNDYFSRTSDFTGNSDSKTFTFSFSGYNVSGVARAYSSQTNGSGGIKFTVLINNNLLRIIAQESSGLVIANFVSTSIIPDDTFFNIMISADLSNSVRRHVYNGDQILSGSWTAYVDDEIDFTGLNHTIGGTSTVVQYRGRISNVFLSREYLDLSIEANRRVFTNIDTERGLIPNPSQLADYNAVAGNVTFYFPMGDPATAHINAAGNGDMVQNGTIARSNRGPNQYNAVASEFDGVSDYLEQTGRSATAPTDLTMSFSFKCDTNVRNMLFDSGGGYIDISTTANTGLSLLIAANPYVVHVSGKLISDSDFILGKNYFVQFSYDGSAGVIKVAVNGVIQDITWTTLTAGSAYLAPTIRIAQWANANNNPWNGSLGDFYLGTDYIDLSISNPFYDIETQKPKYLGENGELPTGSSPLIYLPLRADDAGNNLGTGGDFTVNSGPFVGARGYSEFWARSMNSDSSSYLGRGNTISDSKSLSFVIAFKDNSGLSNRRVFSVTNGSNNTFDINHDGTSLEVSFQNSSGTQIGTFGSSTTLSDSDWNILIVSFDLNVSSSVNCYANTTQGDTVISDYSNDLIGFSSTINTWIGNSPNAQGYDGDIGFIYLTTDYIDFSQESNRLLFQDGLGNPISLQPSIDEGLIPEGLIRMGFEDTDDLGFNSGTGGDFTVNGTVTAGADVNG